MMRSTAPKRRPRAKQAGFSMIELLIGSSVLAVALLGHTASIFSEQRLSQSERARSTALLAAEQFLECMRSDDDYAGLFARLNALQEMSTRTPSDAATWLTGQMAVGGDIGLSLTNINAARTDHAPLADGRRSFSPSAYYDDYRTPSALRSLHVAVAVPTAPAAGAVGSPNVLREDLPLPQFGLPADLNGDGVMDDASRIEDYRVLPIVVTFRWTTATGSSEEVSVSTWLWGNR